MPKVSIIAGSKSDADFVKPIEEILSKEKISFETAFLSAHRDKEPLAEYVKKSAADYFIAVAGLAAALPGSIAADAHKPVIAVPVWGGSPSSPAGLDALLAAVQMPPPKDGKNVALGAVAINGSKYAAKFIANVVAQKNSGKKYEYDVCVIHTDNIFNSETEKLFSLLKELNMKCIETCTEKVAHHTLNYFTENSELFILISDSAYKRDYIGRELAEFKKPLICMPMMSDRYVKILSNVRELNGRQLSAEGADQVGNVMVEIFNLAPNAPGISVGYNRPDNAAYFAKKLLGK